MFQRNLLSLSSESSAVCYSSLEQHERFGLLLCQSVPLPPETWVHMYYAAGDPGITAVHLCSCAFYISVPLCGLFSAIKVQLHLVISTVWIIPYYLGTITSCDIHCVDCSVLLGTVISCNNTVQFL